ncbi:MAG: ABC transporter substrate-binding protein [Deltaproteobacteria bacterium]|nr:ABC transporter substrate-binding protein [Deltaproteobacteria bacterium]
MTLKRIFPFIIVVGLIIGSSPSLAYSEQPMDVLQGPVDQIVKILQDPQFKNNANRKLQTKQLKEAIDKIFNFGLIARGTIGRYDWNKFTLGQRSEFKKIFSEFISNVYFNKIQGDYSDVKISYLEQVMRSDTSARIKTVVIRESGEIPIDYSMKLIDGKWWVYNVFVEGPSLLGNYRDEHQRILLKGSYADLIEKVKKKIEKQKSKK